MNNEKWRMKNEEWKILESVYINYCLCTIVHN